MTPFLILSWPLDGGSSEASARHLRAELLARQASWALLLDEPGRLIAIKAGGRVISGRCAGHPSFLIGDVFSRNPRSADKVFAETIGFCELCRKLSDHFWGAYLAVQMREPGSISVFRDPIGMRDAVHWSRSGLHVISSDILPWLTLSAPGELAIDWDRVDEFLLDSSTAAEGTPLLGVETLDPGELLTFGDGETPARRLWTPRRYFEDNNAPASAHELRQVVTHCVDTWLEAYPGPVIEISGGFDSAVIAAAATHAGHKIGLGVNVFADDAAGDERCYARSIAHLCAIPLHEIYMPVGELKLADLQDMPIGVRPGLGSTSLAHDRLLAKFADAKGADTLITGHGGDAVFFQHPTPMIAADRVFPRWALQPYVDLARWSNTSIWTVARHAFRIGSGSSAAFPDGTMTPLPVISAARDPRSRWAGDLQDLPPAKALHIDAIAGDRSAFGPSWRSQSLTVLHPLLSQPLVELMIGTDTFHLTRGQRDRALARHAFRNFLPASIVERRGKGALNSYFGRLLAASASFLRSYLLDGQLVGHGILDRTRLDAMLNRDALMQTDCYGGLLSALIIEQWTRTWADRLEVIRSASSDSMSSAQAS
jgi:asparagine synthase (glutamine-hydrolysing)